MAWLSDEELLRRLAAPTNEREREALFALHLARADLAFLRNELDALLDLLERVVFLLEGAALGVLRRTLRHGHNH